MPVIYFSGGTSASEGGLGSGSKTGKEKGTVSDPAEKTNSKEGTESDKDIGNSFDPVGEEVEKAEQKNKSAN